MSRTVDAQVQRAIEAAERAGRLVTADTPRGATALRTRHKAGRLASPAPGAFARPEYWQRLSRDEQDLHLIKTESHRHRDWIFAGASAGLLHGLEIPFALRGRICVATSVRSHSSSSTRTQRIRVNEDETVVVSGVPATSLVRTVFDCTRGASLRLGLPVADSALRALSKDPLANGMNTELRELMEQVDLRFSGHRGIENTRRTLALADGRAESGGESVLRAALHELGFATPELQVEIEDPVVPGRMLRIDMGYLREDGSWLLIELDGVGKRGESRDQGELSRNRERIRESHLSLYGWPIMRVGWAELANDDLLAVLCNRYGVPRRGV